MSTRFSTWKGRQRTFQGRRTARTKSYFFHWGCRECTQSGKDRKQNLEANYLGSLLPRKEFELYSVVSRKLAKFSIQGSDVFRFKTQKDDSTSSWQMDRNGHKEQQGSQAKRLLRQSQWKTQQLILENKHRNGEETIYLW